MVKFWDRGMVNGEILPVLGTSTGCNIVLDLNYGRVLRPLNGQYGYYYQYWESRQVQICSDDEHVRNVTRSGSGLCVTGGSSLLTGCVLTDMYSWSLAI